MEYNKGNLRGVYDTLKNEGYTPPEFDEFVNDMQDESNLRDVHSTLRENGYTPPDFDAFKKDMLTPVPAIAGAGVLMGRPPVSPGKIGKQLPTDLSPSVDIPQEDWEDNLPSLKSNSQNDVDARLSDTLSRFESRGENLDRMAERYSPEGRERKRRLREVASLTGLDHRLTGIATAPTPAPADGGQNEGGEPQERVFHTYGAQLYDFALGSDGALHPVYELEDGSLTDDVNVAESAEAVARKDRRDYAQKLWLESPEGMLAEIEARLADVNMRINRSEKELLEAQNDFARDNMFTAMYSAGVGAPRPVNRGDKRGADKDFLLAERDMLEDARRRMSAAVELEKSQGMFSGVFDVWNNVKNLSRGAIDALKKPSVWTFGMTDVRQASYLLGIKDRLDSGEELTDTEMSFAMTAALVDDFNGRSEELLPMGYLGGEIIGDMAPFMAQMALSPASGFGKALARQAVRKFGREGAKAVLMRGAARVVGDIGAAAFLTNTLQLTTTSADIVRRHTGRVSLSETGGVELVGGESWAEAIAKGEGAMVIENFTEYLGEHAFKALGMPIVKGARKLAGKSRVGRDVMDFISNVELSGFGKAVSDLERRAQWNGSVSEILEEEVGIVLNSIFVGDNELKDLVDPREQSLIIIGCGVFGGFVSGLKSAGYMSDRYYGRRVLNNADMRAGAVLGDGWADVRKRIDEADIDGLADILASYISDFRAGNVNEMTVRAVCDYAVSLQRYRGGNIASERARMEGLSDAVLRNLSQAEDAGYEMSESSEMRDAQSEYERQRARLVGELGGHGLSDLVETVLSDIERDPVGALSRTHEESLRGVVLDYVNAMMVRRGVIGRVRDDIDGRVAASDMEVDMRVNKDTGMIHPATVGIDGRAVFIVGGTVSVRDDGSVDFSRSDESVVVKDAATGRLEFVPVRSVKSIGTAIDPASEKTAAAEAIRQEAAQAAVDAMNGTLALNPGDVVQIHDGGGLVDVTVVGPAVNEESGAAVEGRVLVRFPNGSETSFTREQLQAFADAANIERLDRLEQERAGAKANDAQTGVVEAEFGHGEEMVPRRFALNDEFTILKEDGTTVGGTVTGELDSDGKVEVSTDEPINGNVVNLFTPAELEGMLDTYNGESVTAQSEKGDSVADVDVSSGLAEQSDALPADAVSTAEGVVRTESEEASRGGETTSDSAELRVPVDEQGQPRYEEAEPDIAWDAIVEQAKGDEAKAQRVVESMLSDMESEVKRLENKKPDKGRTVAEKMAAEDALEERRATAKSNLDKWRAIAGVAETRRAAAVEAEKRARIEAELAEEQSRRRAEREAREKEEQQKRREQEDKALKEGSPATYRKLMENWSEPLSVEEYILRQLASGYVKLRWESAANGRKGIFDSIFGGRSNRDKGRGSEWQKRRWMIDDIDGLSVDAYIERVAQEFYSDYERDTDHWQEVSNALFDILRSCDTSKAMYEYALELHRNAETVADGSFEAEMAARGITQDDLDRMDAFYEKYGMTEDEWDEFYAAHGHVIDLADAEYEELMTTIEGEIADEYANRQSKELAADSEGQSGAEGTGESGTYVVPEGGLHEQSSRTGRESRNSPQGGGDVSIREESSDKASEEIDKADELTTARRAKQEVESINDEVNIPTILQWSNERAGNGEPFLLGSNGSINLVEIEQEVFDKIGIGKAPFRLTPSMVTHVYERHKKELKLNSPKDAVEAILDVMNNFDHVRKGRDNTYIFSVEGARNNSARRAVTLVLEYDKGEWLGIKTVGYDRISNLKEMTTLWEKGEGNTSATGVAPANVSSEQPSQGNKAGGIASNQSAVSSDGKDNTLSADKQVESVESSLGERVDEDGAQSADVKEKSPAEGKLTEFALKFKDADIDVRAIEREMSEWLSGQTADSLSNVDANMLYRICSVAGLDKGKALAFRKSIDNAMPKDLLSEVWELRRRKNQQSESDKPAFSIDEKTEGNKAAYGVAKRLLEAAGLEVVEVSDAEARAKLDGKGDARLMGSRTDKKMAKVSEHYAGRELDANTQAVVDVFSGKADNADIEVERADGKRRVIMRQGDENRAGTKHSLFRHFETKSNYITADDITMVPEVIAKGERSVNGKKIAYDYVTEDGTRLSFQ